MTVLIISPSYFQETNPRAIQVRKLCDGLTEKSINYYLATYNDDGNKTNDNRIFELRNASNWVDILLGGSVSQNIPPLVQFIKEKNINTLLTISNPATSTFIGLSLKKYFKQLRWISYYSDPLPVYIYPEPYFPIHFYFPIKSYLKLRLKYWYQTYKIKKAFDTADRIILPSRKTLLYLENFYNKQLENKTEIIPHIGGNFQDNREIASRESLGKSLVYFGSLFNRLSKPLVESIKFAKQRFNNDFQGLIIFSNRNNDRLNDKIHELNAEDVITIRGPVSYKESLILMRQSAVLLLVEADMKESPFMPSKYFDYLFSNRPILAVSPLENSLNEHYNVKDDVLIVQHSADEILLAIEKLFCQSQKKINRDLDHLRKEKIVEQYIHLFTQ